MEVTLIQEASVPRAEQGWAEKARCSLPGPLMKQEDTFVCLAVQLLPEL